MEEIIETEPETYTTYCYRLKKIVTLGFYDKFCECGDPIIGVPEKP